MRPSRPSPRHRTWGGRLNAQLASVFTTFLYILIALVVIRSLLSWFPGIDQRSRPVQILHSVTEPLLEPIRRILPRTGMIDLSAMALIILLYVMVAVVSSAADQ